MSEYESISDTSCSAAYFQSIRSKDNKKSRTENYSADS